LLYLDLTSEMKTPVTLASNKRGANRVVEADKLRELASWYREYAERTENPTIWDARIRTAEDLEAEAKRLELREPELAAAEFATAAPHSAALAASRRSR
jgi:hypothetical protein